MSLMKCSGPMSNSAYVIYAIDTGVIHLAGVGNEYTRHMNTISTIASTGMEMACLCVNELPTKEFRATWKVVGGELVLGAGDPSQRSPTVNAGR